MSIHWRSSPPALTSAHYIIKPQKHVENAKRQKEPGSEQSRHFCCFWKCFHFRQNSGFLLHRDQSGGLSKSARLRKSIIPVCRPSADDKGNIITFTRGTNPDYLTARIARDRPDILERMKAGEYKSVRAAARKDGRKRA